MIVNLGFSKSGKRRGEPESIVCRTRALVTLARLVCQDMPQGDYIFDGGTNAFRAKFRVAMESHHLKFLNFKPYSLRRGGATAAFREGASWELLMETGRWADVRTLRVYIADAAVELAAFVTPAPFSEFLNAAALRLRSTLAWH